MPRLTGRPELNALCAFTALPWGPVILKILLDHLLLEGVQLEKNGVASSRLSIEPDQSLSSRPATDS